MKDKKRICRVCGANNSRVDFYKKRNVYDRKPDYYFENICMPCFRDFNNLRMRIWNRENPDKKRIINKRWREKNDILPPRLRTKKLSRAKK
jgi:hypothetical protein